MIGVMICLRQEMSCRQIFEKSCKNCGTVNEVKHIQGNIPQCCYNCGQPFTKKRKKK
jgi:hypothetical protein